MHHLNFFSNHFTQLFRIIKNFHLFKYLWNSIVRKHSNLIHIIEIHWGLTFKCSIKIPYEYLSSFIKTNLSTFINTMILKIIKLAGLKQLGSYEIMSFKFFARLSYSNPLSLGQKQKLRESKTKT